MLRNQAAAQLRVSREQGTTKVETESTSQASAATPPSTHEQVAPVVASVSRDSTAHTGQAREVYDRYITTFKQGNLDGALQGFSQFLTEYPTSDLAANAQYWLGECYYGKKDYARAIDAFDRVKVGYPSSEKVPAALLKKGFAYLALKDRNRASSVSASSTATPIAPKQEERWRSWRNSSRYGEGKRHLKIFQ